MMMLVLNLTGCAVNSGNIQTEEPAMHSIEEFRDQNFAEVEDPWEVFNRSMYRFNFYFDKYIFLPVVNGYAFVTPTIVQKGISNIYSNLGEVRNVTNSMFQLKGSESLSTLGRFLTNSTLGLGGYLTRPPNWVWSGTTRILAKHLDTGERIPARIWCFRS